MKKTNQTLLVNKVQLLNKAPNGKFDSNGKKEVIQEFIECTEQQLKNVVMGAGKSGVYFEVSESLTDGDSKADLFGNPRPDNPSLKATEFQEQEKSKKSKTNKK